MQEVYLARGPILVFCGSHKIPWPQLEAVFKWEFNSENLFRHNRSDEVTHHLSERTWKSMSMMVLRERFVCGQLDSLKDILSATSGQECLLPHDRIFAVLPIIGRTKIDFELVIDYRVPAWVYFAQATVHIINNSHNLFSLAFAMPEERKLLGCPSWAWDLSSRLRNYDETFVSWLPKDVLYRKHLFNASQGRVQNIVPYQGAQIILRGVHLESIDARVTSWSEIVEQIGPAGDDAPADNEVFAYGVLEIICDRVFGVNYTKSLAKTLIAHGVARPNHAVKDGSIADLQSLHAVLNFVPNDSANHPSDSTDLAKLALHCTKVQFACKGRRIIRTSSGRPSLCPESTRRGDQIVLLFGGDTPFVLRPLENENFELVGECYLDGVMFGELMPEIESGTREIRDFILE